MTDYLHDHMAEESRVSFPRSLAAMISWIEARAGIPEGQRISESALLKKNVEQARVAAEGEEDVKRAPRFPLIVLMSMELGAMDAELPRALRIVLWSRLVKVYGGLRADDLRRIMPDRMALHESGLTATLIRTKTSGAGKKIRDLALFVPSFAEIVAEGWLGKGFALWQEAAPWKRDHFLPRPGADLDSFVRGPATVGDMSALNVRALLALRKPIVVENAVELGEEKLLSPLLAAAWTGHSERTTLTSALAAMGPAEGQRPLGKMAARGVRRLRTYVSSLGQEACGGFRSLREERKGQGCDRRGQCDGGFGEGVGEEGG